MERLLSQLPGYNAMKFEPGRDNLFSMRDEVAHTKLRNKMAAGVSSVSATVAQEGWLTSPTVLREGERVDGGDH